MPFAHYPAHYSEMKASLLYGLTIPTNLCRPLANARELLVQCNVGHCLHSGNATESYQHGNVIQFCTEENPRQAASLGKPKQHQPGVYVYILFRITHQLSKWISAYSHLPCYTPNPNTHFICNTKLELVQRTPKHVQYRHQVLSTNFSNLQRRLNYATTFANINTA